MALVACFRSQPTDVAGRGGGAETTDGQIVAVEGMVKGVRVRLVPLDFDPLAEKGLPESFATETDASGRYAFKHIPEGRYNLEAVQPRDGTRLFLPGIVIGPERSTTLPKAYLAHPGKLRLSWEGKRLGYVYMRGTTLLRPLSASDSGASILLDSLPIGRLPPLLWFRPGADSGLRITDSLTILPQDTTVWNVFAAWAHRAAFNLNTTAMGMGTEGALNGFPVLVRLAAADFDFSQASPTGGDIRFSGAEGSELAYYVESWNADAGQADIWVRMPKVLLNQERNSFRMHWGNAEAASRSAGPAVFGPDNGFSAVLPLNEAGNDLPGGYEDVTGSGRNGTGISLAAYPSIPGVIGWGQSLNGIDQWIEVAGGFPAGTAPRSVSLWAKSETPLVSSYLANYGTLGDLESFGLWNNAGTWFAWLWGNSNDIGTTAKVDAAWHRITLDYDGATVRVYVDGIMAGSDAKILATSPTGFTLGKGYEGKPSWKGEVDGVEVSTVSRSPDWVELSFEIQRSGSRILQFQILE